MIDKRFEGESLSGEELRGLLGSDDLPEESAAPATAHVLLVSRRNDDIRLIRSRLEAHGVVVTLVRNPFTALDQLRRARYEGVISDLDLWAKEGLLLLDRVPQAHSGTPVLFLGVADVQEARGLEKRLVSNGAWGMLSRPLDPGSLEKKVQEFVARCVAAGDRLAETQVPLDAASSHGAETSPLPITRDAASKEEAGPDSREEAVKGSAEADFAPLQPSGSITGELAWLRFFFHAGRDLRRESGGREPLRRLARAAGEHLRPRAVSIVVEEDGDMTAFVVRGSDGHPETLLEELTAAAKGAGGPNSITVRTGQTGRRRSLTLLDLPPEFRAAARPFLPDLQDLLRVVPETPSS